MLLFWYILWGENLSFEANELITYAMIAVFILGLFYLSVTLTDDSEANNPKTVNDEEDIKDELSDDIADIEDELDEIEGLLE